MQAPNASASAGASPGSPSRRSPTPPARSGIAEISPLSSDGFRWTTGSEIDRSEASSGLERYGSESDVVEEISELRLDVTRRLSRSFLDEPDQSIPLPFGAIELVVRQDAPRFLHASTCLIPFPFHLESLAVIHAAHLPCATLASSAEDAHAARPDQEADHDERDAVQDRTADQRDDSEDHED